MSNFRNLVVLGGGWHNFFWFGILVEFSIFANIHFADIRKILN